MDDETGLLYYGYRFYDPGKGRWLSRDRLGSPIVPNEYCFCRNDSIGYVDDLGLIRIQPPRLRPGWPPALIINIIGRRLLALGFDYLFRQYQPVVTETDYGPETCPPGKQRYLVYAKETTTELWARGGWWRWVLVSGRGVAEITREKRWECLCDCEDPGQPSDEFELDLDPRDIVSERGRFLRYWITVTEYRHVKYQAFCGRQLAGNSDGW